MAVDAVGFAVLPNNVARDPDIEPPLKVLLLVLSGYAGANRGGWPSNQSLCAATGLSERVVRNWLAVGEERGLLSRERRVASNGSPLPNLYALNFNRWGSTPTEDSAGGVGLEAAPPWGCQQPPKKNKKKMITSPPSGESVEANGASRFSPPTREQATDAFAELGLDARLAAQEGEKFVAHFESNGWKVGGKAPMKSWRAAVRSWFARMAERNPKLVGRKSLPSRADIENAGSNPELPW